MGQIEIYGTLVKIPNVPSNIENWGSEDPKEQYWRRKDLPAFFENVEFNKDGDAILTYQQREYALEEVRRCKDGFWFLNNGIPTYITGKHYFYLQWWKLEDDIHADYRDTDRRYFLYLDHWEKIPWCLGIVRGKKRREGATSQATSNLIYECIFFRNSFCGLVSKTEKDGKKAFTNMVAFGYRQLPVFLKPKQLNNKDSVSELVFAHKSVTIKDGKGSAIDSDTGHRSSIDYRAPGKNAYDSGRLSRGLFDEGGKWEKENPFSIFISIVSKTMVKGAKRVGFMECPSTVNEMSKAGGDEFKKVWDDADTTKQERSANRLVKYFSPAYDGYVGFIDKYGMSVIDEPTEDQYKFLVENYVGIGDLTEEDVRLGAKQYLINKRNQLEGTAREEEIRMNPFDEKEMFLSAGNQCLFAAQAYRMREQLDWLTYNKKTERGNLVWENGDKHYLERIYPNGEKDIVLGKLIWVPNENGRFEKVIGWEPKEANNVYVVNGFFKPNATALTKIGCDPFKYDKTKDQRRSNAAAYVYQNEDFLNPDWEYNDMFVMRYSYRANTTDGQYDDLIKLAWYCGTQILFERNVDGWKKHFNVEKCGGFYMWLPHEVEPGVYTDGQGKTIQFICDITEAYIEKNIHKVYFPELIGEKSGWLGFSIEDTQKFDDVMGAGFTLMAVKAKQKIRTISGSDINNIFPQRKAS